MGKLELEVGLSILSGGQMEEAPKMSVSILALFQTLFGEWIFVRKWGGWCQFSSSTAHEGVLNPRTCLEVLFKISGIISRSFCFKK